MPTAKFFLFFQRNFPAARTAARANAYFFYPELVLQRYFAGRRFPRTVQAGPKDRKHLAGAVRPRKMSPQFAQPRRADRTLSPLQGSDPKGLFSGGLRPRPNAYGPCQPAGPAYLPEAGRGRQAFGPQESSVVVLVEGLP